MKFAKLFEKSTSYIIKSGDQFATGQGGKPGLTKNHNFAYTFDSEEDAEEWVKKYKVPDAKIEPRK